VVRPRRRSRDLSPSLQSYLSTLHAVHDGREAFKNILERVGKGSWDGKEFVELEPVVHPIVRTHPETGEKVLFVNPDSLHTSSNSTVARAMPC